MGKGDGAMKAMLCVVVVVTSLLIGCDSLPTGGKCYDDKGNELTRVFDEDGTEWEIKKATINGISYCSIPRSAKPFQPFPSLSEVQHPNGQMM